MKRRYLYYIIVPIVIVLTFVIISSQVRGSSDETGFYKARVVKENPAKKNCGCAYK